ncbi:hypothetical protein [Solidesulfovibrio sp.]|uniref:hypothetical protein n=1 Tax=Solidesulfovibrio sp. TaxID=2910990 RepID=UPI002630A9ED|nr:hypothetical protein [Solidesulfovibrio sp.]
MATPWVDAAVAWTDGASGFAADAVAAPVAVCRVGLAAGEATGMAGVGCAAAVAVAGTLPVAVAVMARAPCSRAACVATAQGRGMPRAVATVPHALARGEAFPTHAVGLVAARPAPAGLTLAAPECLAGTGVREVARLSSPIATRLALRSPIRPAVALSSFVEIEQT